MRCSYGGIEFDVIRVSDFLREQVYTPDAVTPLYLHTAMQFTCYLNENLTFIPLGVRSPVLKDAWLREHLGKPRQRLHVWLDSALNNAVGPAAEETIIESPEPGFPCDALNGPSCRVLSIDHSVGNRDLILHLQFETHQVTCIPQKKKPPTTSTLTATRRTTGGISTLANRGAAAAKAGPAGGLVIPRGNIQNLAKKAEKPDPSLALLSNRWSWVVDHNDQNLATHIIEGEAYFRLDILRQLDLTPDLFRSIFIHPIPLGFQRNPPHVEQSTDGSCIRYRIEDEEKMMNFPGGVEYNATQVDVQYIQEYSVPNDVKTKSLSRVISQLEDIYKPKPWEINNPSS